MLIRMTKSRARRGEAPVLLSITQGKRGWPALPAIPEERPRAWADTPWRTILGGLLLLVAMVVWTWILH